MPNGSVCARLSAFTDETGPKHWNNQRYEHVIKLRQAALDTAREIWADYLLVRYQPLLMCLFVSRAPTVASDYETREDDQSPNVSSCSTEVLITGYNF